MIEVQGTGAEPPEYHFPHDAASCPDAFLKRVVELDLYELGAEAAAELQYRHPVGAR